MNMIVPFFSVFVVALTFVHCPMTFNSPVVFNSWILYDEVSLFMIYMMGLVFFISYVFVTSEVSILLVFSSLLMILSCILVFSVDSTFLLYLGYEASLLPIMFIIMKWGSYPERSVSCVMLLVYTSFFTFPFVFFLFFSFKTFGTFSFAMLSLFSSPQTFLVSLIIFFTFAVKLPIYGLHFWLPMAHVEAPTFGSMVLAGVLLKLGGVGLIRFLFFLSTDLIKPAVVAYFFVFMVFVTVVCCLQSDFKRLVAYSSVSHMMGVPIMIFSSTFLGIKGVILLMLMHGVSSPLMFLLVGLIYSWSSTRQYIIMRGMVLTSPMVGLLVVAAFFFTLSAPPYPSFLSEVFLCISSLFMWGYSYFFVALFLFMSIVYNLLWFSSTFFYGTNPQSASYSWVFSYSIFLPFCLGVLFVPLMVFSIFSFFCFLSFWGQLGFQEGMGVIMELLSYFHDYMMLILLMIMVFVTYCFGYIIMSKRLDKYSMDSHVLETVWTVIPMVILCFMAFPSLYLLYLMEDASSPSVMVKVVGHQWYWEYQYSNSWFSTSFDSYMLHSSDSFSLYHALDVDNRLVLPSSVNLLFLVTSADVLHSWAVPSLGLKVDAVPGRLNSLVSATSFSGVYYGQCSEICGSNHSYMPIVLEFVPSSSFLSYISNL